MTEYDILSTENANCDFAFICANLLMMNRIVDEKLKKNSYDIFRVIALFQNFGP